MGTYVVPFFSSDGPLVYEKVLERFPVSSMGFLRILQKSEVCSKLFSVNTYVHMLES